jgi:hypothetical protein
MMLPESDTTQNRQFATLFIQVQQQADPVIQYDLPYHKAEFLRYVVEQYPVLLHGSFDTTIKMLEPRQANDTIKSFGNQKAVYAVVDPILPIFYAIRDIQGKGFSNSIQSGCRTTISNGVTTREYFFRLHPDDLKNQPWADGMVYILPKEGFVQGINERGNPIDEWASPVPVKPLAKLPVTPADFPYLDQVATY